MNSHLPGVAFIVRIDGAWRAEGTEIPEHGNPAAVAREHLRRQTARVLRQHSVLQLAAARDAADAALGYWTRPASGPELEAAGAVHLNVTAHDRALAEDHAHQQQAADHAHAEELHRLTHLQHILADPHLRRVWWIAQFPERFNDLNDLADKLTGLPPPHEAESDGIRGDIRRFTDQLVTDLHTPQQRELFLTALIQTLTTLGHHELMSAATDFRSPSETRSTPP
ncbi:hypothetical protein JCM4814A_94640 [Streptomyces phaeofaciens JCM 4814]|uniref:Uncharacterized protein n=1 Tax=Streptomyces phaeofaciens TaxID=68254 RepID=A0A918HR34_9ACTN|nr:hypothetical protein [Streptomyces phaeofaciens]GGT97291.1 hypothetical protein GCM10010226_88380 [Streptomyces phaeofaciens]